MRPQARLRGALCRQPRQQVLPQQRLHALPHRPRKLELWRGTFVVGPPLSLCLSVNYKFMTVAEAKLLVSAFTLRAAACGLQTCISEFALRECTKAFQKTQDRVLTWMAYVCDSSAAATAGCSGVSAGPRSPASRPAVANSHSGRSARSVGMPAPPKWRRRRATSGAASSATPHSGGPSPPASPSCEPVRRHLSGSVQMLTLLIGWKCPHRTLRFYTIKRLYRIPVPHVCS